MTATTSGTTQVSTGQQTPELTATDLSDRVVEAAVHAMELLSVYLGDHLGWYRSLAAEGPATPGELARRTSTSARYAREWLEQQAVAGYLEVVPPVDPVGVSPGDSAGGPADGPANGDERRFALSAAAAEVFTDTSSLAYLAPLARLLGGASAQLPALARAYRTGGGVSWSTFGDDMRTGQADMNRPWFEHTLGPALAGVPDLHAHLDRPGARIAEVGCGAGWGSIALARAYPRATVVGVDIDAPSIDLARANATTAGVPVAFVVADAGGGMLGTGDAESSTTGLDAVFLLECLHDMPFPVRVLARVREALAPGGVVVVMDEAAADTFTPDGDLTERLLYGFSLLVCLPDALAAQPGEDANAATGTVMRASTLRAYADAAGFARTSVLPIDGVGFWRFYRLDP